MSSKVIEITNYAEYEAFKNSYRRGIIFYGADWCHACQQINPLYIRIANRYSNRIAFAHADIQVCKLDFDQIPVFVAFRKGREINSMLGADNEGLKEFVKGAIEFEAKKDSQGVTPGASEHREKQQSKQKKSPPAKHGSSESEDKSEERPSKHKKEKLSRMVHRIIPDETHISDEEEKPKKKPEEKPKKKVPLYVTNKERNVVKKPSKVKAIHRSQDKGNSPYPEIQEIGL